MMRAHLARACLILGLMAWMLGSSAALLHRVEVRHVVCAEHGDTLEVRAAQGEALDEGVSVRAAPDHDHDCPLEGLATSCTPGGALAELPPPPPSETPRRLGLPASGARGPPLAYAPKTSPPSAKG